MRRGHAVDAFRHYAFYPQRQRASMPADIISAMNKVRARAQAGRAPRVSRRTPCAPLLTLSRRRRLLIEGHAADEMIFSAAPPFSARAGLQFSFSRPPAALACRAARHNAIAQQQHDAI